MQMNKWKLLLSAAVITAALSGCGANAQTDEPVTAAVGELPDQQRPGGMMLGGTLGKIKSIDGQSITMFVSSFQPGNRNGGGLDGSGTGGGRGGQQGERPQRQDGQAPSEGGMNFEDMFTDETTVITVTDETKIVATTFENNERKETEQSLSDLKADDVITVTLKEGTQEAESIRLGGFGGGGMMGGGRPQGQQGDGTAEQPAQ
ncbi:hypothetical protein [Paenibacillus radicis (ex Gao et al. 2016)]|uniref:DUF5666 domain-containing protein n=1 Tax=Paenibacillus radicis (ex Gao et al. 2016) TaxID=1737354 RepID=A0A917LXL1_9BACL|nr:hypothetical protein [Paenibacillus radicis (ex Gao et al. 2016)]GGG63776.1 hypothetical protein GCM10010918_17210 [Paenibacillus radicis (ex Gao et al. 2016)]